MNDGASLVIICRVSLFLVFLPWIIALHEFLYQERLCSTACLRPFESVELPNNKEVTRHSKKFALIPNCPIRAGSLALGPGMCLSSWSVNSLTAIILMYLLPGLSYFKSSRSVTAQIIGFAFRAFMMYLVYPYIAQSLGCFASCCPCSTIGCVINCYAIIFISYTNYVSDNIAYPFSNYDFCSQSVMRSGFTARSNALDQSTRRAVHALKYRPHPQYRSVCMKESRFYFSVAL